MRSPFFDAVLCDDDDLIGVPDGGEPVGDGDRGAVPGEFFQALLDPALALVVQGARGLVEDEDGRILQEYAGDGDALFLPAGKPCPAFTDEGVIAVREFADKVVDIGAPGGFNDLVHGGARSAVGDVVPDGAGEEIDVLLDHADLASQALKGQGAHVFSVDGDPAACHVIEAGQERADCCLAAAGRADEGDGSSGRDLEGYMGEDGRVVIAVVKGYVLVAYAAFHIGEFPGVRRILDLRCRVHYFKEAAEAGQTLLHHFDQFHEDLDGIDEDADVKGIHSQVDRFHQSFCDEPAAEYERDQIHHALEEEVPGHEVPHTVVVILFGAEKCLIAPAEFLPFDVFICERLDDADAGQGVLEAGVYIADFAPVFHKCLLHPGVLADCEEEHAQDQNDQRQGETPVDQEEEHERTDDLYQRDEEILRPVVGEFRDVEQVGHELAHHLPGVVPAVIGEGKLFIVVEKLLAHVPLHIGAHHVPLIADIIFAQALHDVHDEQACGDERQDGEDRLTVPGEEGVGHGAKDLGVGEVDDADRRRADQVNKKDRFIRCIVIDKSLYGMHGLTPYMFLELLLQIS